MGYSERAVKRVSEGPLPSSAPLTKMHNLQHRDPLSSEFQPWLISAQVSPWQQTHCSFTSATAGCVGKHASKTDPSSGPWDGMWRPWHTQVSWQCSGGQPSVACSLHCTPSSITDPDLEFQNLMKLYHYLVIFFIPFQWASVVSVRHIIHGLACSFLWYVVM